MSHPPLLPYCLNCHYTLAQPRPRFCGHCGQETDLHPPSVREMLTEYLGHYVALDGPLWRTLWALIALPGQLTLAYFHGRRRHYVLPLRVYLSASFLFFVGSLLLPSAEPPRPQAADKPGQAVRLPVKPGATPAQTAAEAASRAGRESPVQVTSKLELCDERGSASCTGAERRLNQWVEKAQTMTLEQWRTRLRALAPYGMLAMQPLYAALLLGLFAGSGRRYAEHFVFSLHCHSLWFLALLLATATGLESAMVFAVFGHGLVALRRVYGLGWRGAFWRGALLSVGYFALLMLALVALVAVIAATA